jgi:methyltransferase (TIGR00027 family)
MPESKIENISDTARWVALYRALESERPDARFRDPFARRLAGERGEAIARAMPSFRSGLWPMVVRTCVFDELILRCVAAEGCETVVNLAAGLDARPFRLPLPPATRWFDVDLPDILAYKRGVLAGERPVCRYEAAAIDLRDAAQRRALFQRIGAESRKALVVTEGLLVYLPAADVASLAADLHAQPAFRRWLIDIVSPKLLGMLRRRWGRTLDAGGAELQFAPAQGTAFFEPHGWREIEFRSTWLEAERLGRMMPMAGLWRILLKLSPARRREAIYRLGGNVLLESVPPPR